MEKTTNKNITMGKCGALHESEISPVECIILESMSEMCKLFIEIYISRCYVLTVIYVLVLFGHWGSTDGLTCFHCPEISHPRFCDHIQQCNPGQLCDKNTGLNGTNKCYSCCASELCNTNGCGEADYRPKNSIMCYQCEGRIDSETCQKVTFCDLDEMCFISEESRFGEKYYRSGCQDKNLCQSLQFPYPVIGKRNMVRSTQRVNCCGTDLCNHDIDKQSQGTTTPTSLTTNRTQATTAPAPLTTIYDICLAMSPCFNGATCYSVNNSFTCMCTDGYFGTTCQYTDSKGTDFILLFTEGHLLQYATPEALVTTGQSGRLSLYYFANDMKQLLNIVPYQNEYSLNHNVYMTDGMKKAGVELNGTVRTSVYGLSYNNYSGDGYSGGYLAIPSPFLSRNYIVPSFRVYSTSLSQSMIAVTPTESRTIVDLHLKMASGSITYKNRTYSQNDTLTIVFDKHDTFEISHTSDLTGTQITSSSPVAVVSGNKCNYINRKGGCNTFIEMVLPLEQLDTTYVIPFIATRVDNTVRVISKNDTTIHIWYNKQHVTKHIKARDFLDFPHHDISYVDAIDEVYVMIYPHERGRNGDAFMMTIHGINQYLHQYDFVVPRGFTSYISITVQADSINEFILDGSSFNIDNVYTIAGTNSRYSSFSKTITYGEHRITHSRNIPFGLWVYGNAPLDAYGYPAGIAFKTRH